MAASFGDGFKHYQGKIISVKAYLHRHEAELAKGILGANEIDCYVAADDSGGMQPYQSFLSPVRLMVKEQDADKALELLGKDS